MTTRRAELPGGLLEDGTLQRAYAFKPVDGALELALSDAVADATSTPDAVTRVLTAALSQLGERGVNASRVDNLCVGDRQHLMRALRSHIDRDRDWLSATCGHCGARFDLHVDVATLPVTPAGAGFPFVSVRARGRDWRARVPNGADQNWLAQQPADDLPQRLATRLLLDEDDAAPDLDAEIVEQLDAALDAVAPAVVLQLAATCPECEGSNSVALDPYGALAWSGDELLRDVHRIAAHYHWSEADILRLPLARRRAYLDLIDQARGFLAQRPRQ
jgi:hypothetical protein